MRAAAVALLLSIAALPVRAQPIGADIVDRKDIPQSVKAAVQCGTEPDSIFGRAFAGGYVFAWPCPSNHANAIEALVYADDRSGRNARLLVFPSTRVKKPYDVEPAFELANIRWFPERREILSIYVDREGGGFCRIESRWRLAGRKREPLLVGMRKTRDCEGRRGWVTVVSPR